LLILAGWAGQISLGQFGLAAFGAYVAAVTRLPLPLALLAGALGGAAAAVVIGLPALRLRGLHLAIMTLAFHVSVTAALLNPSYFGKYLPPTLRRPSLLGLRLEDERVFYYVTLAVLAATVLAVVGLRRSRTARALLATRDNEQAAQSFGINLTRARIGAFAVSGFIAGLAGALFAFHQHGVKPGPFDPAVSITIFLNTVIGGLATVAGPIIGILYYGIPVFLQLPPLATLLLTRPGGVVLLLLLPGGLGGLLYAYRDNLLRRVARRHRISVPSLMGPQLPSEDKQVQLAPFTRTGGGFVAARYRLDGQWAVDSAGSDINAWEGRRNAGVRAE
jgi:branched-chain amino acid transport system permease protein